MPHEFEKLADDFPLLPKTPIQGNEYDYGKWDSGYCVVKLCNVPWSENYEYAVDFECAANRDLYLDSLNAYTLELQSGFRKQADEYVKLPLPIANAYAYNYMVIDYPIPPNSTHPIDFATNGISYRRELYFIGKVDEVSPNTTRFYLSMDIWQMWRYAVDMKQFVMDRGHVAVKNSSMKSEYIECPKNCTDWLLDKEPIDDFETIKNNSVFKPLGGIEEYYIAAFSLPFELTDDNLDYFKDKGYSSSESPTYSGNFISNKMKGVPDIEEYTVSISENTESYLIGEKTKFWYGVLSDDTNEFFNTIKNSYKYILNNISKIYLISASFFVLHAIQNADLEFYRLNVDDYSETINIKNLLKPYSDKVKYTKELVYPYARIQITDNNGYNIEVKTQDCDAELDILNTIVISGSLCVRSRISGINGGDTGELEFVGYDNREYSINVFSDDSNSIYSDFGIPTFAVYCTADDLSWYKDAGKRLEKQRTIECAFDSAAEKADLVTAKDKTLHSVAETIGNNNAVTAYDNSIAGNATAYSNALAANATAYSNATASNAAAYANAYDVLNADYANAIAANANAKSVSDASANTVLGNALAANASEYGNALRTTGVQTANATESQTFNSAYATTDKNYNTDLLSLENTRNLTAVTASNTLQSYLIEQNVNAGLSQSVVSALSGLNNGTSLAGILLSSMSTSIGIVNDQNKAQAIIDNNTAMYNATQTLDGYSRDLSNQVIDDKTAANNAYIANTTGNSVNAANANAADSKTTADNIANAANTTALSVNAANKTTADNIALTSYDKGTDIADRTKSTDDGKATATKTTADSNAAATKTTADANALRSYNNSVANNAARRTADDNASDSVNAIEKFVLRNDVEKEYDLDNYSFISESYKQPIEFSEFNYGATDSEYLKGWKFIVVGLKNDSKNKIESFFDRYGYSCEYKTIHNISKLQIMEKCTYWKIKDGIIIPAYTENKNAESIKELFKRGILIYDNPENIGLLN